MVEVLLSPNPVTHSFSRKGDPFSNLTDDEFVDLVKKGIHHCYRGDVFQIVLSRRFSQPFTGDDFTLYRVLRSVNPSPYLFYFDFGEYQIFGSSPEAQLVVKDGKARFTPLQVPSDEQAMTSKMPNVQLNWPKIKKKTASM